VKAALLMLVLALAGCSLRDRQALGPELAAAAGWRWQSLAAGPFDLAVALRPSTGGDTLTVYIEGDGLAYLSPTERAMDPTPTDPLALRLALAHPGNGPVAYLARPCQYRAVASGRNCRSDYWTVARYAPEVVDSAGIALDQLKARLGSATRLILVGYSGGGAMAALLAERRNDVVGLVTVAANLDLEQWVHANGLTPLRGSLDPAADAGRLATLPQIHFVGAQDRMVDGRVASAFLSHQAAGARASIVEIEGQDHACCWATAWPALSHRLDLTRLPGWIEG
jgi:pimeloyl-ACP methyl ester carboxylesterase